MKQINEYIQNEMDAIIVKTLTHVLPVLDEKGAGQAKELILMIANGIKTELLEGDMSTADANVIYDMFLNEINAAVFEKKH
ncbi:MAG: hypothetical protein QM504_17535 [Pseudomonadota bacterium]